ILTSIIVVLVPTVRRDGWLQHWRKLLHVSTKETGRLGILLLATLVLCHIIFH
ncbi:MAG: hypothetical protein GY800_02775, partial [Planctomycetes bacterium]|nr:hypothetical protein [Planctomycetota bacterium]